MSDGRHSDEHAGLDTLDYAIGYNSPQPISVDDVEELLASWTDSTTNDYPNFVWLLALKDGKYAAATGEHDYTGWDCQSSLTITVHDTYEEACRFGLTAEQRSLLGVPVEGD